MDKKWVWSTHIWQRMKKRNLSKDLIESVVNSPDEIISAELDRQIYQKIVNDKLVRVVVEENTLVTVYMTSKIKKYMRGQKI